MSIVQRLEKLFESIQRESSIGTIYLRKDMKLYAEKISYKSSILDIGCGTSPYRRYFSFDSYVSVDISRFKGLDVIGDICKLPFILSSFDVVVCTEVLEHVKETDVALEEIRHVLRSEGLLLLSTPFVYGVHDDADFYRFTEAGLKYILGLHGFEALEISKRGGIMGTLGQVLAKVPYHLIPYSRKQRYGVADFVKFGLLSVLYLVLIPITRALAALDSLDKNRHFTIGYTVLCVKKETG